jgi:hypothetical protein
LITSFIDRYGTRQITFLAEIDRLTFLATLTMEQIRQWYATATATAAATAVEDVTSTHSATHSNEAVTMETDTNAVTTVATTTPNVPYPQPKVFIQGNREVGLFLVSSCQFSPDRVFRLVDSRTEFKTFSNSECCELTAACSVAATFQYRVSGAKLAEQITAFFDQYANKKRPHQHSPPVRTSPIMTRSASAAANIASPSSPFKKSPPPKTVSLSKETSSPLEHIDSTFVAATVASTIQATIGKKSGGSPQRDFAAAAAAIQSIVNRLQEQLNAPFIYSGKMICKIRINAMSEIESIHLFQDEIVHIDVMEGKSSK